MAVTWDIFILSRESASTTPKLKSLQPDAVAFTRIKCGAALAEPLVLPDRLPSLALEGEEAYDPGVRLLAGRLHGDHLAQRLDPLAVLVALLVESGEIPEQAQVCLPQLFPAFLGPFLVAVLRQQLARVRLYRRPEGRRLPAASGGLRGFFEGVHVHPELARGAQDELSVLQAQG